MPIYAYSCTACGQESEFLLPVASPAPDACVDCGAAGTLRKQVTAAAFRLRGGGWYETDFKTGEKSNLERSDDAREATGAATSPKEDASSPSSDTSADSATTGKGDKNASASATKVSADKPSTTAKSDA